MEDKKYKSMGPGFQQVQSQMHFKVTLSLVVCAKLQMSRMVVEDGLPSIESKMFHCSITFTWMSFLSVNKFMRNLLSGF